MRGRYTIQAMADIRHVLANMQGERINFLLANGKDLTGRVTETGDNYVIIDQQPSGRIYYIPFTSIVHFTKAETGGIH
jgi:hypothetical protein